MQINLNQQEIEQGIRLFLESTGMDMGIRKTSVEFTAGRKESGLTAAVAVEDDQEEITRRADAEQKFWSGLCAPLADEVGQLQVLAEEVTEDTTEQVAVAVEEATEQQEEIAQAPVELPEQEEAPFETEEAKEEVTEEAAPAPKKKSLFA